MNSFKNLRIGDTVKVILQQDEDQDESYIGRIGIIKDFQELGFTGDTADDPSILIEFEDGDVDYYWHEELEFINRPQRVRPNIDLPESIAYNIIYSLLKERERLEVRKKRIELNYERRSSKIHHRLDWEQAAKLANQYSQDMLNLSDTEGYLYTELIPYLN